MKKLILSLILLMGLYSKAQQLVVSQFNAGVMTEGTLIGVTGEVFNREHYVSGVYTLGESILHKMLQQNLLNIEENPIEHFIVIYPNPFKDILYFHSDQNVLFEIELFDLLGKEIKTLQPVNNQIDLSHLASGTYLLTIKGETGLQRTQKIIKL